MTIGIISAFHSGVDVVVEWKINSFFTLSESDGAFYCSPYFSFGGETWRLGIYPNGWSGSHSSGHVDLELCKDDSDRCIKQSFSLSLKTMKGEKYNEEHYTKEFDSDNWTHELNRFIPRYELTRRRSELMLDGVLIVICTMKHTTPARSAEEEASNAEVSKSDVAEAPKSEVSGSSQAGTKESVSKWIKENNKEASKGKKRKMEEENDISDSAEYSTSDSDSDSDAAERSSDSDSGECCHKCPDCLDIVKKQKLEELESQKERSEGEGFTSRSSRNPQENKVLHDLKELFLKKEGCDVVLKVKGSEFPAHRLILRARSPVFASTFRHDMKENATGIVEIEDCNLSSFSDFLCFLYCGDIRIISQENVFDLFTAADKYQVLDLRVMCWDFMKMNLAVNTFCETISLALRHSETDLIKLCTDYFKKNAPKIIVTVKWQTFLAENPTESNELFIKLLIPNSS